MVWGKMKDFADSRKCLHSRDVNDNDAEDPSVTVCWSVLLSIFILGKNYILQTDSGASECSHGGEINDMDAEVSSIFLSLLLSIFMAVLTLVSLGVFFPPGNPTTNWPKRLPESSFSERAPAMKLTCLTMNE